MMKQLIFKYEPNSHPKKKYKINSLIYTLSFLVIYPSNSHFYKCQSNTQFFQKALFNSFYQTLNFLKMHFFIMHFLKTQLFQYTLLQKAEPNSPLTITDPILHPILNSFCLNKGRPQQPGCFFCLLVCCVVAKKMKFVQTSTCQRTQVIFCVKDHADSSAQSAMLGIKNKIVISNMY